MTIVDLTEQIRVQVASGHATNEPISIGGQRAHEILHKQLSSVVGRIVARHRRELEDYRRLPREVIAGDVTSISRDALGYYIGWLRDGTGPTPAQLARIGQSAAARAEDGLPLPAILAAYLNGVQEVFHEVTASAGPSDVPAVLALTSQIFDFLRRITDAVTKGYLDELRANLSHEHNARQALLDTLLRDASAGEAIRAFGIRLHPSYILLNLAIGPHPDEHEQGVKASIVGRRMLRRVLAVFASATDDQALASLQANGGIVLIPAPPTVDWTAINRMITAATEAAGTTITVAASITNPAEVPAAVTQTSEMLDVLHWFERPPGVYQLDDILVEYQLTRPSEARSRLAATLTPLHTHPELLDTLTEYINHDLNRRRTASLLHVHPNTIDYRLRRIADLTGVDATQPAGINRLIAALAAQRAQTPTADLTDVDKSSPHTGPKSP